MHIIPVNSDGVYYGIGANRLEMYLLLGKFDSYMISQIRFAEDQTDSDVHFELNIDEHNNRYMSPDLDPDFQNTTKNSCRFYIKLLLNDFPI